MNRDAVALVAFTHEEDSFAKGVLIPGLDAGQFDNWEHAELVREATAEEIAAGGVIVEPIVDGEIAQEQTADDLQGDEQGTGKRRSKPTSPPAAED